MGSSTLMGSFHLEWWKSSGNRWWSYNIKNVFNATELQTQKWLKWSILCCIHFTRIKKESLTIGDHYVHRLERLKTVNRCHKLIYRMNVKLIKTPNGFFMEQYDSKWLSNAKSNRQENKNKKTKTRGKLPMLILFEKEISMLILFDISCPDFKELEQF